MDFTELSLKDVYLITPKRFGDARGFFSETYNARAFQDVIGSVDFVQDNHSLSRDKGVLRGLHFQKPPFDQGKLVRCPRGKVLDVIVDLRRASRSYGQHLSVELSSENWQQLWVPPGFAHGFCTLSPDTEFCYKVTNFYAPDHDAGLRFDDPDLNINWPFSSDQLTLSDKDKNLPYLRDIDSPF